MERTTVNNYTYRIAWSDEDAGYIATCIELPYLSGFGESPDDALAELRSAIKGAVETLIAKSSPIPRPLSGHAYSGQFRMRVPKSMHRDLALRAEGDGVSLNTLILTYLAAGLSRTAADAEIRVMCRELFQDIKSVVTQVSFEHFFQHPQPTSLAWLNAGPSQRPFKSVVMKSGVDYQSGAAA
jgi:predicted RNase H-like HicB family nuclease